MVAVVGLSFVVWCPSSGHIWKTKQTTNKASIEHYIEVGTADSVASFRSTYGTLP